jgi:hypothetical protein
MVLFDHHFLGLHDEWQETGKEHAGIFRLPFYLQGERGIGPLVKILLGYHEMIEGGAGSVEDDIRNHLIYV